MKEMFLNYVDGEIEAAPYRNPVAEVTDLEDLIAAAMGNSDESLVASVHEVAGAYIDAHFDVEHVCGDCMGGKPFWYTTAYKIGAGGDIAVGYVIFDSEECDEDTAEFKSMP